MTLAAGTAIGKYVVLRKLAEGGMAEVYLCAARGPEGFEKEVALKRIRSALADDPSFVEMFVHEARIASKLNHANVVQIFDFDKHEDSYYLAMEYVRGRSLWDIRRRAKERMEPIPALLAAQIGVEVAKGLSYAHRLSHNGQPLETVHRDVTPHNVLVSYDGAVKLTDFGIAKAGNRLTAAGVLKGKFAYMSPEQARGERVDSRTDVFALGIVVWEMLTGARLFEGDSDVATLRAVQESTIAPPRRINPDVPELLDQAVMKALARDRSERYQSAGELERGLAECILRCAKSLDEVDVGAFVRKLFAQELAEEARAAAAARENPAPKGTLVATPAPRASSSASTGGTFAGSVEKTYVKPGQVFAAEPLPPPQPAPAEPPKVIVAESQTATPAAPTQKKSAGSKVGLSAGVAVLAVAAAVVGVTRPWSKSGGAVSPAAVQRPAPTTPAATGRSTPPQGSTNAQPSAASPSTTPPPTVAAKTPGSALPNGSQPASPSQGKPTSAPVAIHPAPAPESDSAPATGEGELLLKVRPWATVFIDGERRGTVQGMKPLKLAAGKHDVRLSQGHRAWSSSVTIVEGKTFTLEHDMRSRH